MLRMPSPITWLARAILALGAAGCLTAVSSAPAGPGTMPHGRFLLPQAQAKRIVPPPAWRERYHEVERCAGLRGKFEAVRWNVMDQPLQGDHGPIYGLTQGSDIVLVRGDTTYLKHEILHHVLLQSGWRPPSPKGGRYTVADLHPMPLFGLCTGGH